MKKDKIVVFVFLLCEYLTLHLDSFIITTPLRIKLKSPGLQGVFAVESVRQITEEEQESVLLNISVTVKKGKIESVSRRRGDAGSLP